MKMQTIAIVAIIIAIAGAVYALGRSSVQESEGTASSQAKPTHTMDGGSQMQGATHPGN